MKKHLYVLVLLYVLAGNSICAAQVPDSARIINTLNKCWRAISRAYSTIYGLEEEEIKVYYKQRVCFTRDSVIMYSGPLYNPKYSIKKVNAAKFARNNFDCSKEHLGMIADSVYEVTISSTYTPPQKGTPHKMTDVIAFDGECIYVVKDGVIFKLYDANAKPTGRSAN